MSTDMLENRQDRGLISLGYEALDHTGNQMCASGPVCVPQPAKEPASDPTDYAALIENVIKGSVPIIRLISAGRLRNGLLLRIDLTRR